MERGTGMWIRPRAETGRRGRREGDRENVDARDQAVI